MIIHLKVDLLHLRFLIVRKIVKKHFCEQINSVYFVREKAS